MSKVCLRMATRRVLFVAENVTLAQVVRLATLARGLEGTGYEVHFACAAFEPGVFRRTTFTRWHLPSVAAAESLRRVEQGRRIYDEKTLGTYVEHELELFAKVEPDLVVGDFRLSLSVSAPVAGAPYAALINAYWSPYAIDDRFPLPDHPLVELLGVKLAKRLFPLAFIRAFRLSSTFSAVPAGAARKEIRPCRAFLTLVYATRY